MFDRPRRLLWQFCVAITKSPRNILVNLCLAIAITFFFPLQAARADVILHAFDWNYSTVAERAKQIGEAGYRAVLVTPPLKSPKPQNNNCSWYLKYQPQDFRVIDNCDGNKEDFVKMISALNAENIRTYADVVVNHMANERNGAITFPGDETLKQYADNSNYWERQKLYGNLANGLFSPGDFHTASCITKYTDKIQVINGRICGGNGDIGLPDLNDNEVKNKDWVIQQRKEYIQSLYDLGVRGFRLDAAKHMPNDAIRAFIPDEIANNSQIFAETITNGGVGDREYDLFVQPYLQELPRSFGAYDFPLLNAIKRAFNFGAPLSDIANPYSTGNALENSRAVTVVITHDIPYNEGFRYLIMDPVDEDLGYAYLMGRDGGNPLVLDDGSIDQIDNKRWVDFWNRDRIKRMISFHNRMQGKGMEVLFADRCSLLWRREEDGIVAINKCSDDRSITVNTSFKLKWNHPYRDALTDEPLSEIIGSSYTFNIPGRTARMWYAQ